MSELLKITPQLENHPHLALVELHRPKVLNALSTELMNELADTFLEFNDNGQTRAIILTGSERAFSAGADIAQMVQSTPIDQILDNRFRSWQKLSLVQIPIIAAVRGLALGGGCELAMSCDMIIAGDSARFGQPEIKIGTIPGAGGTQRLVRALGKAKATELILTGEMFSAQEAFDWGLINKVVPDESVLDESISLAKKIADHSPIAVKLAKESILKSYEISLSSALEFERRNFYLTFSSEDQKEGMTAFLEKRTPQYKGR